MFILKRIINILLRPKSEWAHIASESTTITRLYLRYIIPLAAIETLAIALRIEEFLLENPGAREAFRFLYFFDFKLTTPGLVIDYGLHLAEIYLLAILVNVMVPLFLGERNQIQALKVVTYASTASWLGQAFLAVPIFSLDRSVVILSNLYTVYLFYLGSPALMKIPTSKAITFTGSVH